MMAGLVFYRGQRIEKPGTFVDPKGELEVKGDPCPYVSRGGLKLAGALDQFKIPVRDKAVLDAGASTGGFTQCLLERGARQVYAVDVGYGQLAWELRQDPRVIVLERTNLRYLAPDVLGTQVDLATLDLSFISLEKVLIPVRELLKPGGEAVALVKPQFEAGRKYVGKGGIVKEKSVHCRVLEHILGKSRQIGFQIKGLAYSPLLGADGNLEFFLWMNLDDIATSGLSTREIEDLVTRAHTVLLGSGK